MADVSILILWRHVLKRQMHFDNLEGWAAFDHSSTLEEDEMGKQVIGRAIFALLVLVGGAMPLFGQIDYEILTGATESAAPGGTGAGYPINTWYHDTRTESIYLSSELNAAGVIGNVPISAVSFKCSDVPGRILENVRIRMKHTTATTLTTSYESGYTDCFGPTTIAPTAFTVGQWYKFTFATPFIWDGTSNIVVDYSTDGIDYSAGGGCFLRAVTGIRNCSGYSDSANGAFPFTATMGNELRTSVPSIKMTVDGLSVISLATLPGGAENVLYNYNIQASQGTTPYTWSNNLAGAGNLPASMTLNQAAGSQEYTLAGTPDTLTKGTYTFDVTVSDANLDSYTKTMTLVVEGPTITTAAQLPAGIEGTAYVGVTFQAIYGSSPYTWAVVGANSLPSGLSLSSAGVLSGTPQANTKGTSTFDVQVTDAIGSPSDIKTMSITIDGITITTAAQLPTGAVGSLYVGVTFQAAVGPTPYDWAVVGANSLPNGLSLSSACVLSGTPLAGTGGTRTFDVQVTDGIGSTDILTVSMYILPLPASLPFTDDFSSDTSWQLGTGWDRNVATPYTGSTPTRAEPGTDHTASTTDNNILGHNIGADYALNVANTVWAISPPFDCAGNANVRIQFYRWIGIAIGTTATIDISTDGINWNSVWISPTNTTTYDGAWVFKGYDVTAWAANQSIVQFRFGMGATGVTPHIGWCIDDLEVIDPGPGLEVKEGGPTGTLITDNQANGGLRDFGTVVVNTNSVTLDITLYNNGLNTINITNFGGFPYLKTGADIGDFTVTTNPAWTILPGNSTTFSVSFYSSTPGVSTCTIQIGHDAPGSGTTPFEINLRGEAVPLNPTLQVDMTTMGGTNIPYQDPAIGTAREFSSVAVNSTSTLITIVVSNQGTSPLIVSSISLAGKWWTQFSVNPPATMPAILNNGQSASFTVAFEPTSAGLKDAHVRIVHNGVVSTSPFEVPVLGNALAGTGGPFISVSDGAGDIAHNVVVGGPRDFGNVVFGSSSAPLTIVVANSGGAIMNVSTPTLGGANAGEFSLDTIGLGPTIGIGVNSTFTITFSPTSIGVKTATVTFTHDDPAVTFPFVINIEGTCVPAIPVVVVSETDNSGAVITNPGAATGILDFGTQDIAAGAATVATIYVENTGTSVLTLGTPDFNPIGNTEFSINTTGWPASLAIGASATFSITFDPTLIGVQNGVIEFTHNDAVAGSPFILNVTGTGSSPVVQVREGSTTGAVVTSGAAATLSGGRDLGSIDISAGATGAVTVTLINTGTMNLTIGVPTLTGTNAADFALIGASATLVPMANTSFTVTFDPTLGGIKNAQIEFTHNDLSNPNPFIVPILGTAVDPAGLTITTTSLPPVNSGNLYTATTLTAVNGVGALTWSLYSANMPAGMTLSAGGVISGTPNTLATTVYNLIIQVADTSGSTHEKTLSITVVGDLVVPAGGGDSGCIAGSTETSNLWLALLGLFGIAALSRRMRTTKQ